MKAAFNASNSNAVLTPSPTEIIPVSTTSGGYAGALGNPSAESKHHAGMCLMFG